MEPVDDALVEVGRGDIPDLAREHDVVAVVHLGEVVEAARLLRKRQAVLAAAMLDLDEAFFDVNVGLAVFAHRPELHEVTFGSVVADRPEHVERPLDVRALRVNGVLTVDHRVRGASLFGEVHEGLGLHVGDDCAQKLVVAKIADPNVDT